MFLVFRQTHFYCLLDKFYVLKPRTENKLIGKIPLNNTFLQPWNFLPEKWTRSLHIHFSHASELIAFVSSTNRKVIKNFVAFFLNRKLFFSKGDKILFYVLIMIALMPAKLSVFPRTNSKWFVLFVFGLENGMQIIQKLNIFESP